MTWEREVRMVARRSIRPGTEAESSPAAGLRSEDQTKPAQLTIDAEAESGWTEP